MEIRFSYEHVPTLGRFASSDAFMRAIVGPIGSGKSSASVCEFPRRALAQAPGRDGIRRTRWAVIRSCFDDTTEILTERRGWQLFRDLFPEDAVATLVDGKLVYERPSAYYAYQYSGEMIGLATDGINMLVTPDHNLWTSKRKTRAKIWAPFDFERAKAAYGRTLRRFKRDAEWVGGNARYTEDFHEFLGFWFAEGHARVDFYGTPPSRRHRLTVTQKEKWYVRDLLSRAGLRWGEYEKPGGDTNFSIKITDDLKLLIAELFACGKSTCRAVPFWMKNCPSRHAAAFIRGYLAGDGHKSGGGKTQCATTSSKMLADDLQEIALRAGLVVNIVERKTKVSQAAARRGIKPSTEYFYELTFLNHGRLSPVGRSGWFKINYSGMVYCLTVPSHVVYVRRRGKGHWSSQTYPELRDTTIRTFHTWLPPEYFGRWYAQDHRYVIKAFGGCEFEVLFRALDKPDDIKKLLSLDLTGAWVNEARETPWAIIDALGGRLGRYPAQIDGGPTWFGMWMDTNPPDTDSRFFRFFEDGEWKKSFESMRLDGILPRTAVPSDFAEIFRQPSGVSKEAENLPNLPPGYYHRLMIGKSREWVKVYVNGEYGFVSDDRGVFPEYSDEAHLKEVEPVPGVTVYRGWDFGLTPCCVFSQVLPDGRWLIFDELVSEDMGIERFSSNVLDHCARSFRREVHFEDYGDPAGQARAPTDEKTCFDILQSPERGIMIQPGLQTLQLRLECVRKVLQTLRNGRPQFVLHPRCRTVRKAFLGGYHYRRLATRSERYTMEPEKNHPFSDVMDCIEYVGTILFGAGLTAGPAADDGFGGGPARSSMIRGGAGRSEVTGY